MNPSRLIRLYDAKFSNGVRNGHQNGGAGRTRYVDMSPMDDDEAGTRLAAYFAGGE